MRSREMDASRSQYAPVFTGDGAAVNPPPERLGFSQEIELQGSTKDEEVELESQAAPKATEKDEPSPVSIPAAIALYALCSSTLLIINKVAMKLMPDASFLLFCQFLSSSLAVRAIKITRPEMDIEFLTWKKTKPFAVACLVFYMCLLSNTEALHYVNVETVIVVRSCSPIAVSILDHVALGRALPNAKGALALLCIAGGAVLYVMADSGFQVSGYAWLTVYFVFIVTEMVFVKFVVDTVPMSTWTRVYYNNTLSLPLAILSAFIPREHFFLTTIWTASALLAVGLSCVVGVAISYAGFTLRKLISATSFTVVGVVCKIATVLINDLIWTHHSSLVGHLGLLVCIASGVVYEQVKVK